MILTSTQPSLPPLPFPLQPRLSQPYISVSFFLQFPFSLYLDICSPAVPILLPIFLKTVSNSTLPLLFPLASHLFPLSATPAELSPWHNSWCRRPLSPPHGANHAANTVATPVTFSLPLLPSSPPSPLPTSYPLSLLLPPSYSHLPLFRPPPPLLCQSGRGESL